MTALEELLDALSDTALANVTLAIDQARIKYRLTSNTVDSPAEFDEFITDFTQYIYRESIAPGANLSDFEASGRAKQMLERTGRRRGQTLINHLNNCLEGLEGGKRAVADALTEAFKSEASEHYIDSVIDRFVSMNSWPERLAVTQELMKQFGHILPASIRRQPPEYYAAHYKTLLKELVSTIRENARQFRAV